MQLSYLLVRLRESIFPMESVVLNRILRAIHLDLNSPKKVSVKMSKVIQVIKLEMKFILKACDENPKYFGSICFLSSLVPVSLANFLINFFRGELFLNQNSLYQKLYLNKQLIVLLKIGTLSIIACLLALTIFFFVSLCIRILVQSDEDKIEAIIFSKIDYCFFSALSLISFSGLVYYFS